jgi:peptidoglycan/LPS O-acetylase OafA/YrhL
MGARRFPLSRPNDSRHLAGVKNLVERSVQLPSLNGWRALSIGMVLISHYFYCAGCPFGDVRWNSWFEGKFGVRCFFTISGFLITWLLICEREKTGAVSLRSFYIRRSLRILPVYGAVLLALWIMHLCRHPYQEWPIWVGLLTFTRNFVGTESNGGIVSAHLWSLSIEEQFYLFWPVTFQWFMRARTGRRNLYWLLGAILVAAPIFRLLGALGESPMIFGVSLLGGLSTFAYLDYLAYGCLMAFLLFYERGRLEALVKKWNGLIPLVAGFLILVPYIAKFGNVLQAAGFSLLVLYSILNPQTPLYRFLNLKWVSFVGIISYSLYMWQQFSWNLFDYGKYWLLAIIPILAIGCLSYFLIEKPFLRLRKRFRNV